MFEPVFKFHFKMSTVEHKIRRRIREYEADVVISVHPLMNDVPLLSCMKISNETNRHLPFFTVVTDLGSGHCAWFEKDVEKMFIASNAIEKLARERGNVPADKIVMSGLPIRYEFAFESERLGDRTSMEGKIYQLQMRGYLRLFDDNNLIDEREDRKVLLVMGGGEGVGSLENIVHRLYLQCSLNNIRAIILVVCGRNEVLKQLLENYDWDSALEEEIASAQNPDDNRSVQKHGQGKGQGQGQGQEQLQEKYELGEKKHACQNEHSEVDQNESSTSKNHHGIASRVTGIILNPLRVLSLTKRGKEKEENKIESTAMVEEKKELAEGEGSSSSTTSSSSSSLSSTMAQNPPQVIVQPLGFVSNMAEYMVAADILITKAGPGTIAEAASLGLPVLLTSFLPGQEEGNVDFVLEKKFGQYQSDSNPNKIASMACEWLRNPDRMVEMSLHAKRAGMPNAAEDIVKYIGKSTLRWKEVQEEEENTLPE